MDTGEYNQLTLIVRSSFPLQIVILRGGISNLSPCLSTTALIEFCNQEEIQTNYDTL